MIPIDSHHEARLVSYVALVQSVSPLWICTRQSRRVPLIATSHDTAPAGSKYLASERNRWALLPYPFGALRRQRLRTFAELRLAQAGLASLAPDLRTHRSVCSPPGCRWPAVATSSPSRSATHSFCLRPPV